MLTVFELCGGRSHLCLYRGMKKQVSLGDFLHATKHKLLWNWPFQKFRFSILQPCGKQLSCKSHICEKICHNGSCGKCPRAGLRHCPCGKKWWVGYSGGLLHWNVVFNAICETRCVYDTLVHSGNIWHFYVMSIWQICLKLKIDRTILLL